MKNRSLGTALIAAITAICAASVQSAEQKPLWVLVTTQALELALKPLVDKRTADGFETVVSTRPVEKALPGLPRRPDFVLLVGDYQKGKEQQPWYVATKWMKPYRWKESQKAEFASDAAWGDLDGDLLPDVPVGRIPARTREEAALVVTKILAYETSQPGLDDLRLPVLTGATGYGPAVDALASGVLLDKTRMNMPEWCEPRLICGDVNSPFCGWPKEQPAVFNRELKQGCLIGAMMGHGVREAFQAVAIGNTPVMYTLKDAESGLAKGEPTGPVFIFACHTGDFAGGGCCLAEMMVGSPGGPVAVVAAAAESQPLPNYYSSICLLSALVGKQRRLGPLWLEAQREMMKAQDPMVEAMLADVEGKLEPQINIPRLKRDQMLLYEILGDPATPLFMPEALEATIERMPSSWHWKATKPQGAQKLYAGFRAQPPAVAAGANNVQAEHARAVFKQANAGFLYVPLESPEPDAPWEGTVGKPGSIRLVATGPGVFRVAVLKAEAE